MLFNKLCMLDKFLILQRKNSFRNRDISDLILKSIEFAEVAVLILWNKTFNCTKINVKNIYIDITIINTNNNNKFDSINHQ